MASRARLSFLRHHRRHPSPIIIRCSHFSTNGANGARVEPNGSRLDFGWVQTLLIAAEVMVKRGFAIVPQATAYIVERGNKYDRTLPPGFNLLIPFRDRVSHMHSLKVRSFTISNQRVFSKDNTEITIESCIFFKVVDPVLASYEAADTIKAMTGLVEGIVRSNVGGNSLNKILYEREHLNKKIAMDLCDDAKLYGLRVLDFEIRDISVSPNMKKAMIMEACADFKKRAQILNSEGERQSSIIIADGTRLATIHSAKGEAEALELKEAAKGKAISAVSKVLVGEAADRAVKFKIARQTVEAFGKIAELGTTLMLPEGESEKKDK